MVSHFLYIYLNRSCVRTFVCLLLCTNLATGRPTLSILPEQYFNEDSAENGVLSLWRSDSNRGLHSCTAPSTNVNSAGPLVEQRVEKERVYVFWG